MRLSPNSQRLGVAVLGLRRGSWWSRFGKLATECGKNSPQKGTVLVNAMLAGLSRWRLRNK